MHRPVARLAALSLVALGLGAGAAAIGTPASAAGGTFASTTPIPIGQAAETNSGPGLTINDTTTASVYPSTTSIDGLVGTVTDVNVTLTNLSHTFPADIDVLLVGPHGQQAVLMSDAGGTNDLASVNFTFDDQASAGLGTGANPSGSYKPTNFGTGDPFPAPAPAATTAGSELSVYNGTDANGTWSLYVLDDSASDTGTLGSWNVAVTTSGIAPYPSTIAVSGQPKGITDVNVTLSGLTHTFPGDIDVLLVGPAGQQATILSDTGSGTDVSNATLVLDDAAAGPVPSPVVGGTFQPTNPGASVDAFPAPAPVATGGSALSTFNGTDPNGTWSLYVVDDSSGDLGSLTGWSLQIATVDAPAAPAIAAPANGSRDRDGVFSVSGNAPSGSTVKVLEGGAVKATTTASAIGQWAAPVSGFTNGSHTLTATSTDSFGNVSAASPGVVVIVDSIGPAVSKTTPKKRAKGASRTASIKATTNEAVRRLTVTKANAFITVAGSTTHLKAKVTYKAATRTIVINPKADLRAGTTYKVTITTKVLDLAGNPLDQKKTKSGLQKKTWKFTTR